MPFSSADNFHIISTIERGPEPEKNRDGGKENIFEIRGEKIIRNRKTGGQSAEKVGKKCVASSRYLRNTGILFAGESFFRSPLITRRLFPNYLKAVAQQVTSQKRSPRFLPILQFKRVGSCPGPVLPNLISPVYLRMYVLKTSYSLNFW